MSVYTNLSNYMIWNSKWWMALYSVRHILLLVHAFFCSSERFAVVLQVLWTFPCQIYLGSQQWQLHSTKVRHACIIVLCLSITALLWFTNMRDNVINTLQITDTFLHVLNYWYGHVPAYLLVRLSMTHRGVLFLCMQRSGWECDMCRDPWQIHGLDGRRRIPKVRL